MVSPGGLMAPGERARFTAEHCQALSGAGSVQASESSGLSKVISNIKIVAQTEKI